MAGAKLIVLPNIALAFENKFALIICYQGFVEADNRPGMPVYQGTFVETKHPQVSVILSVSEESLIV